MNCTVHIWLKLIVVPTLVLYLRVSAVTQLKELENPTLAEVILISKRKTENDVKLCEIASTTDSKSITTSLL